MTIKYKLKPQHTQFRNIVHSGNQYFEYCKDNPGKQNKRSILHQKSQFVYWCKQEMLKHNIQIIDEFKTLLMTTRPKNKPKKMYTT